MNPFDLSGPSFLLFYGVLAAVLIGVAVLLRRGFESGAVPDMGAPDPYLLATLRGGRNEMLRVVTIVLLGRGLLKAEGNVVWALPGAVERVRRPIERSVLEEFAHAETGAKIFAKPGVLVASNALRQELVNRGLLPNGMQIWIRILLGACVVLVLIWVAHHKIDLAHARGRHNTGILETLAFFTPFATLFALRSRRTLVGQRVLEDFQELFSDLRNGRNDVAPGGGTIELSLVAGLFGLTALSGTALAQADNLFPKASSASSSCGAGGGSSCGSGGGSSCGGSCGGGGGCGGCGGCGS